MNFQLFTVIVFAAAVSSVSSLMECNPGDWKHLDFGYDVSRICRLDLAKFDDCDSINEFVEGVFTIGNGVEGVWSGSQKDINASTIAIIRSNASSTEEDCIGENENATSTEEAQCAVKTEVDITVLYRLIEYESENLQSEDVQHFAVRQERFVVTGLHLRSAFLDVDLEESEGSLKKVFVRQNIIFRLASPKPTLSRFMSEVILSPIGSSKSWMGLLGNELLRHDQSRTMTLLPLSTLAIVLVILLRDYV